MELDILLSIVYILKSISYKVDTIITQTILSLHKAQFKIQHQVIKLFVAETEHKGEEVNMYRRSFNFTILQLTVLIFVTKTCKFEQFPLAIIYKSTGTLAELFNYTTCHLLHPQLCAHTAK